MAHASDGLGTTVAASQSISPRGAEMGREVRAPTAPPPNEIEQRWQAECQRLEVLLLESRGREEDARHEARLCTIELESMRERNKLFDPAKVEGESQRLCVELSRLQEENQLLTQEQFGEVNRLRDQLYQIRAKLEAEFRTRLKEAEGRIREEAFRELDARAREAFADREELTHRIQYLNMSMADADCKYTEAQEQRRASRREHIITESVITQQAQQAVALRKRLGESEAKVAEMEALLLESRDELIALEALMRASPTTALVSAHKQIEELKAANAELSKELMKNRHHTCHLKQKTRLLKDTNSRLEAISRVLVGKDANLITTRAWSPPPTARKLSTPSPREFYIPKPFS